MRVRFKGDGDHTVTTVYGQDFPVDEWVEVHGLARKLGANPAFDVDTDGDDEPGPTVEELRAQLDAKGIAYHPRAGVAKLSALLTEEGA